MLAGAAIHRGSDIGSLLNRNLTMASPMVGRAAVQTGGGRIVAATMRGAMELTRRESETVNRGPPPADLALATLLSELQRDGPAGLMSVMIAPTAAMTVQTGGASCLRTDPANAMMRLVAIGITRAGNRIADVRVLASSAGRRWCSYCTLAVRSLSLGLEARLAGFSQCQDLPCKGFLSP